jgi:hypothetical protein
LLRKATARLKVFCFSSLIELKFEFKTGKYRRHTESATPKRKKRPVPAVRKQVFLYVIY